MTWPIVISIEGNIGSGKSTIIQQLSPLFDDLCTDVIIVDEPVDEWKTITDVNGKTMIELFYSNPSKYSFVFQMMAYISRLVILKKAIRNHPNSIIITERCLDTDYNIFATMLYEQGQLLKEEFDVYKKWFDYFAEDIHISGYIYIRCNPEVSHERCMKRARLGEDTITLDYLTTCHLKHEKWMSEVEIPYITIDNDETDIDPVLEMVYDFIMECNYTIHPSLNTIKLYLLNLILFPFVVLPMFNIVRIVFYRFSSWIIYAPTAIV